MSDPIRIQIQLAVPGRDILVSRLAVDPFALGQLADVDAVIEAVAEAIKEQFIRALKEATPK